MKIIRNNYFQGVTILLVMLFSGAGSLAQQNLSSAAPNTNQSASATEALQKATQNPVANLISVPLQDNTNLGIGPFDRNQNVLNVQPIIAVHMTSDWNLIIKHLGHTGP